MNDKAVAALMVLACSAAGSTLLAQPQPDPALTRGYDPTECASCAEWNQPQEPFRVFGNTWFVGTAGLSSLLITSDDGHVLIDGGLPDTAPLILGSIRALGFDPQEVEYILNSHAHHDHAGGIAALQQATGAVVLAGKASAAMLTSGAPVKGDPQYAIALSYPGLTDIEIIEEGRVMLGGLTLTAHATPGHTPGGTTWTWRSCEDDDCRDLVYADSVSAVSADGFLFSDNTEYPSALADFERSFSVLEALSCDILLTPHPWANAHWQPLVAGADDLGNDQACRDYAAGARAALQRRLDQEEAGTN